MNKLRVFMDAAKEQKDKPPAPVVFNPADSMWETIILATHSARNAFLREGDRGKTLRVALNIAQKGLGDGCTLFGLPVVTDPDMPPGFAVLRSERGEGIMMSLGRNGYQTWRVGRHKETPTG